MRYLKYALPLLIIGGAVFGIWYFDDWWEKLVSGMTLALLSIQRFGIRYGTRRVMFFVIMGLLPVVLRRKIRGRIAQWDELKAKFVAFWKTLPRWVQVTLALPVFVLAVLAILTAGGFVRFLAFPPLQYAAKALFGEWFKNVVVPPLMRVAAARGLERIFPFIVELFPQPFRRFVRRLYTWLIMEAIRKFSLTRKAIWRTTPKPPEQRKETQKMPSIISYI